jgi:hypothetical protein
MKADPDLEVVKRHELDLLDLRVRRDPAALRALLDPEFREFGASGRVYDREEIIRALGAGGDVAAGAAEVSELAAVKLSADVVLVTYIAKRDARVSLRSSIWRRRAEWTLLFHQGTVVPS